MRRGRRGAITLPPVVFLCAVITSIAACEADDGPVLGPLRPIPFSSPACATDADCPGERSDACGSPRCDAGACVLDYRPTGAPCGAGVCDGNGTCVACNLDADCGSVCAAHVCMEPTCSDAVRGGGESDVDCGGRCAPCALCSTCPTA